jgi:hypothetical protein
MSLDCRGRRDGPCVFAWTLPQREAAEGADAG